MSEIEHWTITEDRVLLPASDLDLGLTAHRNANEWVAVELGMAADPVAFAPEVVDHEMRRLGCRQRPDGSWQLSWRWRKEYLRDASAAAGQAVFDAEWLDAQRPYLRDPVLRMDLDVTPAEMSLEQATLGQLPEGYVLGPPTQTAAVVRLADQRVSLAASFWRETADQRRQQLGRWLVPRRDGRLAVWVLPDSQPEELPPGVIAVEPAYGAGMDVGEGVSASETTIQVFRREGYEQAAEFGDATITPTDAGRFAAAVCRYYHDALICPVRRMHGLTVLRALVDDCGYGMIWHGRISDRAVEVRTDQLGWAQGEMSDEYLTGPWIDAIQYGRCRLHSLTCWQQHGQYIYDELGRITHQALADEPLELRRRHGDRVVACCLGYRAACDLPLWRKASVPDDAPYGSLNWRREQRQARDAQRAAAPWYQR